MAFEQYPSFHQQNCFRCVVASLAQYLFQFVLIKRLADITINLAALQEIRPNDRIRRCGLLVVRERHRVEHDLATSPNLFETELSQIGNLRKRSNLCHRDCRNSFIVCLSKTLVWGGPRITGTPRQVQGKIGQDVTVANFDVISIGIANKRLAERIARITTL